MKDSGLKGLRGSSGNLSSLGRRIAWTPKVCKIIAFMAMIKGLGLLFCILLGFWWRFRRELRKSWQLRAQDWGLRVEDVDSSVVDYNLL